MVTGEKNSDGKPEGLLEPGFIMCFFGKKARVLSCKKN